MDHEYFIPHGLRYAVDNRCILRFDNCAYTCCLHHVMQNCRDVALNLLFPVRSISQCYLFFTLSPLLFSPKSPRFEASYIAIKAT